MRYQANKEVRSWTNVCVENDDDFTTGFRNTDIPGLTAPASLRRTNESDTACRISPDNFRRGIGRIVHHKDFLVRIFKVNERIESRGNVLLFVVRRHYDGESHALIFARQVRIPCTSSL